MKPDYFIKRLARILMEDRSVEGGISDLVRDMAALQRLMRSSSEFQNFCLSRQIDAQLRNSVTKDIFSAILSPVTMAVLELLIAENRMSQIPQLAGELERIRSREDRVSRVTIELASDPDEKGWKDIESRLAEKVGGTAEFTRRVNPALLGGVKVRINNLVIDGSVSTQIDHIRQLLNK